MEHKIVRCEPNYPVNCCNLRRERTCTILTAFLDQELNKLSEFYGR